MRTRLSTLGDNDAQWRWCAPRSVVVGALVLSLATPARAQARAPEPAEPAPLVEDPAPPAAPSPSDADPALDLRARAVPPPRAPAPYFPVSLALLHPISTNVAFPELQTNVAIGIALSRVGSVDGAQLGLVNSIIHDLHGLQLGAVSLIDGDADGAQLGGVFAFTDGPLQGVQLAGLLSWSGSSLSGLQLAGAVNQARNHVRGVQVAGGVNLTYGDVEGVQIGAVNIGKVRGVQLGLINVSADTEGTQIGVINVARRSSGLQVGVINITDNLEGESLGIASVPRMGGVHLVLWGSNSLAANFGVKFASKFTYSILSAAVHRDDKSTAVGAGLTLGIRFPFLSSFIDGCTLGSDFGGYRLFREPGLNTRHDEIYKARAVVAYEIARHFSLFAGGGAHLTYRDDRDEQGHPSQRLRFGPEFFAGLEL